VLLVTLEGIDSMEAAEKFKMTELYARREDIPVTEGSFFIEDLVGLEVFDADSGKKYGVVKSVDNFGASDIYTVKTPTGEFMIPVVEEYVPVIDLEKGIFIRPIEGMIDEN
jgi:16S rRNA processing protein RimM